MPPPWVGPWPSYSTTTAQFWTWPGHWPYIEEGTILADTGHTRAAALTRTAATPQGLSWERSYPLIWLQPDQSLENIKPVQNIGKVKWNDHSLQTMLALCTQQDIVTLIYEIVNIFIRHLWWQRRKPQVLLKCVNRDCHNFQIVPAVSHTNLKASSN